MKDESIWIDYYRVYSQQNFIYENLTATCCPFIFKNGQRVVNVDKRGTKRQNAAAGISVSYSNLFISYCKKMFVLIIKK